MSFHIFFIKTSIIIIYILKFFQIVSASEFNYEILTYTKQASANITQSPEFFNLKKFHYTVPKRITLENGNQILCHIPIFSENIDESKKEEINMKEIRNLTFEESEEFLAPLKDFCSTLPTRFFLYEFCYRKYGKQFDDTNTMFWGNKQSAETYFLGVDSQYNITTGKSLNLFNEKKIWYLHTTSHFALVRGRIVKTYGYMFTERFLFDTLLKITFSLPLTEIIKHKDMVITIDGLTYEQAQNITSNLKNNLVIVERIIYASAYDNHFIMEDMLPFDFTTENYKISKLPKEFEKKKKQIQIKRSPSFFFYKNYLYVSIINGQFFTSFEPFDYILMIIEQKTKLVQIKSVISDNLIELFLDCASDDEISFPIFSFFSLSGENHTFSWVVGLGKISLYDTIIFGRNTSFIEIGKNDIIAVIIENKKIELFVKEVFSNEILIIETHPLKNIEFDGEYLIGKQLSKEIEDSDNEKIHEEKDSLKHFTTHSLQKNIDIPLSLYFSKPNFNKKLLCPESFKLLQENRGLMMFDLRKLIRRNEFSLTIILSENLCRENGIHISFLTTEKIIINNYKEKDNYITTGISFENTTISNQTIWILIDQDVIHLGFSRKIGFQTQLFEFPIRNQKLKYFQFKLEESFNIQLNNIIITDFEPRIEEFLKYFGNHPRKFLKDNELTYFEYYDKGTECILPNKRLNRKTTVEYICSEKGSLLEIIEAYEPDTCQYHLKVATYLLCPNSWKFRKANKNFNKIFCHSDD